MPVLQIRGGDLDLVQYDFSSFKPGENINTAGLKPRCALVPKKGIISVKAPSRIHLSVLDMNRFSPGIPGGGGFGFALQVYQTIEVSLSDDSDISSSRKMLIQHLVSVFKKVTGYQGNFSIKSFDNENMEHIGLGSTCTLGIAVLSGMNELLGNPLTKDDLRVLLGFNYVEEINDKNEIVYGFETGLGAFVSLNGGMNIISDKLTPIYTHSFAEEENVYILIPYLHKAEQNAGEDEFSLLMNRARLFDNQDREHKAYTVVMDFIPALDEGDLRKMGDIMWNLEFRGSKRAEIEHHSFVIYHYLDFLRNKGIEFAAMSSVGPSICVVTLKSREEIDSICKEIGLSVALQTKTDNKGIMISWKQ